MHSPEKRVMCGLKVNTNAEGLSDPGVEGRFSDVAPGSADWHDACKCVLIKCKLIRFIDLDMRVFQSN